MYHYDFLSDGLELVFGSKPFIYAFDGSDIVCQPGYRVHSGSVDDRRPVLNNNRILYSASPRW